MSTVHRLIYVSAARQEMTPQQLDSILNAARRNNEPAGVTGLLLFHDGSFFQALEGSSQAVDQIFARIESDPRHSQLIVLQSSAAEARAFPSWSMGFMNAHTLRPEQKTYLVDLCAFVGGIKQPALSSSPSTAIHINAFLNSFREFAEI